MYKNYIEMTDYPGQWLLTATEKYGGFGRECTFRLCSSYNAHTL
jgi:predicted YcjX-like family ATPase